MSGNQNELSDNSNDPTPRKPDGLPKKSSLRFIWSGKRWIGRIGVLLSAFMALYALMFSAWHGQEVAYEAHGMQQDAAIKLANANAQLAYDLHVAGVILDASTSDDNNLDREAIACYHSRTPITFLRSETASEPENTYLKRVLYTGLRNLLFGDKNARMAEAEVPAVPDQTDESPVIPAQDTSIGFGFTNDVSELLHSIIQDKKWCGSDGGGIENLKPTNDGQDEKRLTCIGNIRREIFQQSVSDRASGLHGRPAARSTLVVTPGEGNFLQDVRLINESYRNRPNNVPTVSEKISEWSENRNPLEFRAEVACTNSRGTGRTCASSASVEAVILPQTECGEFFGLSFDPRQISEG